MPKQQDEFEVRRAQRQKLYRKRRRKRILISLLLILISVGIVLSLTVLFPIKKVNTKGSKIYIEQEILENVQIKGKNLFTVNREKAETELRKKLPLIDGIEFKRKLPDTVTVKVTDAKEYIFLENEGKYYTVSKKGYVMEEYPSPPENLIEVKYSKVTPKIGEKIKIKSKSEKQAFEDLLKKLTDNGFNINKIDVSNIANLTVQIEGRFTVKFGTQTYLDNKISHLKGMVQNIEENRKGDIDLSMWTPQKSEGSFTAN